MVDMSWLRTFPIFRFSPRHPSDPRYQALVKFNAVTMQHGIGDLNLGDFLLALSVYATLVDRAAKNAVRFVKSNNPPSLPSSSTSTETRNTATDLFRRRTAPVSYSSNSSPQSSTYRAYHYHQSRALPSLASPVIRHRRPLKRPLRRTSTAKSEPSVEPPQWTLPPTTTSTLKSRKSAPCSARQVDVASRGSHTCTNPADPHLSTPDVPHPVQPTLAGDRDILDTDNAPGNAPGNGAEQHNDNADADNEIESLRRWSVPDDVLSRASEFRQRAANDVHLPSIQVHLLHHMMRHANSIYGLPLTVASAPGTSLTRLKDRAIVCKLTGILSTDVFHADFRTMPFNPAYYVAVDHRVDAIVICIRGTANIVDTLTDVAATQDPFVTKRHPTPASSPVTPVAKLPNFGTGCADLDDTAYVRGYGHSGVLRSARNLFKSIRDIVLEVTLKYPNYTIVTTGHSLGGAIAAVLALLFRDDTECPNAVSVAFAPPPCVTYDLAEQTAALGVTVVNGPDIVPRLSVALLLPLFATARYVADLSRTRKTLLAMGVKRGVLDWSMLESVTQRRTVDMEKLHDGRRLFLPGRVVQLLPREDDKEDVSNDKSDGADAKSAQKRPLLRRKKPVDVVCVSRTKFLFVKQRQRGMFMSHAPVKYRKALAEALYARNESVLSVGEAEKMREKAKLVGGFAALWARICNEKGADGR